MPGADLIRTLLQQASAQGSRSTALNPLGWALTIVLSGLLGCVWQRAELWLIGLLAAFSAVILIAYVGSYLFFMIKNPDALRSERFTLSKMQIERSHIGDTSHGFALIDTDDDDGSARLMAPEGKD